MLRNGLDDALSRYDVLLAPTAPTTATPLAVGRMTEVEQMSKAVVQAFCTAQLNLTGHPTLALPSGVDEEGLPTSVQLIGRRFDEATVLRAAAALEDALRIELSVVPLGEVYQATG